MPISITCPCGQYYDLPDELAGKKARCQTCSQVFAVPAAGQTQQPMAQPQQPMAQPQQSMAQPQQPTAQPFGQQPLGQPPMGQPPMGQQPMGQQPMGQQPMGQQPMGQPPMGQQPMGQAQQPMAQPMAYPQTGYQNPAQSKGPSKAKLYGMIGGGVGVIAIVIVVIVMMGGNGDKEKSAKNSEVDSKTKNTPSDTKESKQTSTTQPKTNAPKASPKSGNGAFAYDQKSKKGRLVAIKEMHLQSLKPPKVVVSRNGQFIAITEYKANSTAVKKIDLSDTKYEWVLQSVQGYTIENISNDGKRVVARNKSGVSVVDLPSKERRVNLNGFPKDGVLTFSSDSKSVLVDDRRNSFLFNVDTAKLTWGQERSARRNSSVLNWSQDLGTAYYYRSGVFWSLDEKTGTMKKVFDTSTKDHPQVAHAISRFGSYGLVQTNTRLHFANLMSGKLVGDLSFAPGPSQFQLAAIADYGTVAMVTQTAVDQQRNKSHVVSVIDVQKQQVVDSFATNKKFSSLVLSSTGASAVTTIERSSQNFVLQLWSNAAVRDKFTATSITTFVDSIAENQRVAAKFASMGQPKNNNTNNVAQNNPGTSGKGSSNPGVGNPTQNSSSTGSSKGNNPKRTGLDLDSMTSPVAKLVDQIETKNRQAKKLRMSDNGNVIALGPQTVSTSDSRIQVWIRSQKKFIDVDALKGCFMVDISHDGVLLAGSVDGLNATEKMPQGLRVFDVLQNKMVSTNTEDIGGNGFFSKDKKSILTLNLLDYALFNTRNANKVKSVSTVQNKMPIVVDDASDDLTRVFGPQSGDDLKRFYGAFLVSNGNSPYNLKFKEFPRNQFTARGFSKDTNRLLYGSGTTLVLSDVRQRKNLAETTVEADGYIERVFISPDAKLGVAYCLARDSSRLLLFSLTDNEIKKIGEIPNPSNAYVHAMQFSKMGSVLVGLVSDEGFTAPRFALVWQIKN